jgi:hypothetical protein
MITGAAGVLMLLAALALTRLARGAVAVTLSLLILLDIIGTAVAGYFLESMVLMAAMALALVGWLLRVAGGK